MQRTREDLRGRSEGATGSTLGKTLSESQIWTVVTFLSRLEKLPPAALKVLEPPPPARGLATAPVTR
jgi:hypothetical protein